MRCNILIAGPSGAGKTWVAAHWAAVYHALFPTREILLFSMKEKDENFDVLPFITRVPRERWDEYLGSSKTQKSRKRVKMNEEDEERPPGEPYKIEELANKLFIFDDIGSDSRAAELDAFRLKVMTTGRQSQIDVISCTHLISYSNSNREMLAEITRIVVFPTTGVDRHIRAFFKNFVGMKEEDCDKMMSRQERSLMLCLHHPRVLLTSKAVWLYKPS
ncbi:MAG: hypothetical protein ACEQSB_06805 [Undibacterium sp.]